MLSKVIGPDCPNCGCTRSERTGTVTRWGDEFENRKCGFCGHGWRVKVEAEVEEVDDGAGVVWIRPRCKRCSSVDVPVQHTVVSTPTRLEQHRKCRDCGHKFKSVAE